MRSRTASIIIGSLILAGLIGCESESNPPAGDRSQPQAAANAGTSGGQPAYIDYTCAKHGTIPVAFRYGENNTPVEFRVGEEDWVKAYDESGNEAFPTCPLCGKRLFVKPADVDPSRHMVTWHCDNCDHEVTQPAGAGPKTCPECGEMSLWVTLQFRCREHGPVPVSQQYDEHGKRSLIRVGPDGEWVPPVDEAAMRTNLVCPVCGKQLLPPNTGAFLAPGADEDEDDGE